MLKRISLLFVSALLAAAIGAGAANLPLLSGPNYSDPSQVLPTVNTVIQNVNAGVTGVVASIPAPVATTSTPIQTLWTYILPANQLAVGQTFHVHLWGVNSSDASVKTVTFAWGASTDAYVVTGSGLKWELDFYVNQQVLGTTSTAVESETAHAFLGTPATIGPTGNQWGVSSIANTTILIEGTAATSGTITVNGLYAEVLR